MTIEQSSYVVLLYVGYVIWDLRKEIKKQILDRSKQGPTYVPLLSIVIVLLWIFLSSRVIDLINPNPPLELKASENFRLLEVASPSEIPVKILTNPELALKALRFDYSDKVLYLVLNFAPSCFLAFLSPAAILPALPWLILSVLSSHKPYYQFGFQYPCFTLPFIFLATIDSLRSLSRDEPKPKGSGVPKLSIVLLVSTLMLSLFASPISPLHEPGDYRFFRDYGVSLPSVLEQEVSRILGTLESNSCLLTTSSIFPHVATHANSYVLPSLNAPSLRLYESSLNYLKTLDYDYIFYTYFFDRMDSEVIYQTLVKDNDNYGLALYGPGLELYRKGYKGSPVSVPLRFSYKELSRESSSIVEDSTSYSGKVIMYKSSQIVGGTAGLARTSRSFQENTQHTSRSRWTAFKGRR
jgi:uncharacterized membrane protein